MLLARGTLLPTAAAVGRGPGPRRRVGGAPVARAAAAAPAPAPAADPPPPTSNSSAPPSSSTPPPVLTRLRGRGWRAVGGGGALVPLASPADHGLPFAVGLFIAGGGGGGGGGGGDKQPQPPSPPMQQQEADNADAQAAQEELLELHYVVAGSGTMRKRRRRRQDASGSDGSGGGNGGNGGGRREALGVGDSVIAMAGNAVLESGGGPGDRPLVTLRALLPLSLATAATAAGGGGGEGGAAPAPSFGAPLWRDFSTSPSSGLAGVVGDDLARVLLGAVEEEQEKGGAPPPPPALFGGSDGKAAAAATAAAAAAATDVAPPPSSSSSSPNSSVLKRALLDVGAYKLPQQTNRLALLFGRPEDRAPGLHASVDEEAEGEGEEEGEEAAAGADGAPPLAAAAAALPPRPPLCLSFGVEMFEPGHVTPQHVHDAAHELFFVLAGEGGEAVFSMPAGEEGEEEEGRAPPLPRWGPQQRVPLSPGDVAVFPPGVRHGLDNRAGGGASTDAGANTGRLYCVQLMLPNEQFVEFVRSGGESAPLDAADRSCLVLRLGC